MTVIKIYFARPISGRSGDEVFGYYEQMRELFQDKAILLMPTVGKGYLRFDKEYKPHGYTQPLSKDHAIVERDLWMVSQADVVFVNLEGSEHISIGSVCELAWAHLLRKHTIIALEVGNCHEHAFIMECADVRFESAEDAVAYITELAEEA